MNNRITVKNGIEKKNWVPALNNTDFNHFSSDIFPDNIGCYFFYFSRYLDKFRVQKWLKFMNSKNLNRGASYR